MYLPGESARASLKHAEWTVKDIRNAMYLPGESARASLKRDSDHLAIRIPSGAISRANRPGPH